MKFLILGGCGFMGTNLSLFLSKLNHEIIVIDNFTNCIESNKQLLLKVDNIKIINSCATDIELMLDIIKDIDYAINLCSSPCINHGFLLSEDLTISNILTSQILIQSASHSESIKKIILCSNLHVYGEQVNYRDSYHENYPCNPINPLGSIKLSEEIIAKSFANTYKIPLLIARTSQCFGKCQNIEKNFSFIEKNINLINLASQIISMSDLENTDDYLFIDDFCNIIYKLFLYEQTNLIETFNVSSNNNISYNFILENIFKLLNQKDIDLNEDQTREIKCILYDFPIIYHIKANNKKLLDTFPDIKFSNFETSLIETINYYLNE